MKHHPETEKVLEWLRNKGACPRSMKWIESNPGCTPEQFYNAVERYDFMVFLLRRLGKEKHVMRLDRILMQMEYSAYWIKQDYRRFINRHLCDNVRYRVPYAEIRQALVIQGVLR